MSSASEIASTHHSLLITHYSASDFKHDDSGVVRQRLAGHVGDDGVDDGGGDLLGVLVDMGAEGALQAGEAEPVAVGVPGFDDAVGVEGEEIARREGDVAVAELVALRQAEWGRLSLDGGDLDDVAAVDHGRMVAC